MHQSLVLSVLALSLALALGVAGCGSSNSITAGTPNAGASPIYMGPGGPASLELAVPFLEARVSDRRAPSVTSLGLELLDARAATVATFTAPVPPGTSTLMLQIVNLPVGSLTLRVTGLDSSGIAVGYASLPVNLASGTTRVIVDALETGGYALDATLTGTDLGKFVGTSNPGGLSGYPNDYCLACDGLGNLALADRDAGTVTVYSPQGARLRTFPAQEPAYMQGDASGNFYVNSWSGLLQKFAPDGSLVKSTQIPEQATESKNGTLLGPAPLAVDSSMGLLYVPLAYNAEYRYGALTFDLSLNRTGRTVHTGRRGDELFALSSTFDSDHRFIVAGTSLDVRDYLTTPDAPIPFAAFFFDSALNLERQVRVAYGGYTLDHTDLATIGGVCADTRGASYLFHVPTHWHFDSRGANSQIYKYDDATGTVTAIIPLATQSWTASTGSIACDPNGRLYVLTIPYDTKAGWRKTTWTVSRYIPAP